MFDHPALWEEIGYSVSGGLLAKGRKVILERTNEASSTFLEEYSSIKISYTLKHFEKEATQNEWLVNRMIRNLKDDELRHDDIVVIHPDAISAREGVGPIRKLLFEKGVQTHLAGVDTNADVFFRTETPSVTFTGDFSS